MCLCVRVFVSLIFLATVLGAEEPRTNARIIGGEDTSTVQHPYFAALFLNFWGTIYFTCAGTLVTRDTVISAAHCFSSGVQNYRYRLGATDIDNGVDHFLTRYTNHEQRSIRDYDISLAKLSVPVTLGERIGLARLPTSKYVVNAGDEVLKVGWGSYRYGGPYADVLQQVKLYVFDQDECEYRYLYLKAQPGWGSIQTLTPRMMCTGLLDNDEGGKGACQGDGGGPVIHNGDVIVGITSSVLRCGEVYYPDVNVRVTAVSDWILKHIHS